VNQELVGHIRSAGFPHVSDLIHTFIGGSELHGAKLGGTDDMDIYGVYVPRPSLTLGLRTEEHFVWSTAGDDRRNTAADVDVTLYTLRKWAALASKGNPTALHFLFSPTDGHPTWSLVVRGRDLFLARAAAEHFIRFAQDQIKRLTGESGRGKKGQRPDLEVQYGFDTKAAMHSIRLLYECLELMREHTITLPRPEKDVLISIRRGDHSFERVLGMAKELMDECERAAQKSTLPERVDVDSISELISDAYIAHWQAHKYV